MEKKSIVSKPTKKIVRVMGKLQLPVKVGDAACYWNGEYFVFTDTVKRILEISFDCAKIETTSYIYTIETNLKECGQRRMAA